MSPFERGFIKRGIEAGFSEPQLIPMLKKAFELADSASLFDVADGSQSTSDELMRFAKHIAGRSAIPGAIGAGIGALTNKTDRKKGALIGGGLGLGLGAATDMYQLGANSRDQFTADMQKGLSQAGGNPGALSNAKNNLDVAKGSNWFDYYYPPRILEKLR
jgi:hypothetical protein